MDPLSTVRRAVERVLTVYTTIPYAHGELRCEVALRPQRAQQHPANAVHHRPASGTPNSLHGLLDRLPNSRGQVQVVLRKRDGLTREAGEPGGGLGLPHGLRGGLHVGRDNSSSAEGTLAPDQGVEYPGSSTTPVPNGHDLDTRAEATKAN